MGSVVVNTSHRASGSSAASAPVKPLLSLRLLGLSVFLLASTLLFAGLMSSCRTADPTSSNPNEQPLVRTTVVGTVVDESGLPVQGATVTAHGQTATSDKNGYFVMQNVSAPKDRCLAMAKMDGYFTAAKADATNENGLTQVKLYLMSHGIRKSVNASAGGTLNVSSTSGNASLKFEPNGIAKANGEAFNGDAKVAVRYLDPADPTFAYYFAGDQQAVTENGDRADLISYGVLRVDLRSASGEQLQPAEGKPAEITYPIPANMLANSPATMPLWFFDEQKGMWVEEGLATRQGNAYVGTVKHFTDWNCDKPSSNNATLTGLVHCNGVAMPYVVVRIGQITAYTNESGRFTRFVPIGIDLDVVVDPAANQGLFFSDPMVVTALTSRETRDITISLTSNCPASISGTLTDDGDRPLPGNLAWKNEKGEVTTFSTMDGTFKMRVPGNTTLSIEAGSWACPQKKSFSVTTAETGEDVKLGNLKLCSTDIPTTGDIEISAFDPWAYASLTPDGSKVVINGYAPVAVVRNTNDGTLISTPVMGQDSGGHYTMPAFFSSDGSRMSILDRRQIYVFEVVSGKQLTSVYLSNGSITPDGNSVIGLTGNSGKSGLVQYSVATGKEIKTYPLDLSNMGYWVTFAGITADGNRVVLVGEHSVIIYDLVNETVISNNPIDEVQMPTGLYGISADGSVLCYAGEDGPIGYTGVVNTQTGAIINKLPLGSCRGTVSPDGKMAAVQDSTLDGTRLMPKLVDITTGAEIRTLTTDGEPGNFYHFSFSADGKKLVGVYSKNGKLFIRIWDV